MAANQKLEFKACVEYKDYCLSDLLCLFPHSAPSRYMERYRSPSGKLVKQPWPQRWAECGTVGGCVINDLLPAEQENADHSPDQRRTVHQPVVKFSAGCLWSVSVFQVFVLHLCVEVGILACFIISVRLGKCIVMLESTASIPLTRCFAINSKQFDMSEL